LLGFGVPAEWLADVKDADEDGLLVLADHLPREAAEALFDLATGIKPRATPQPTVGADPFEHPDARRRFRVISDADELERALDYPWEKWAVFLHPAQRDVVERRYNGPARVAGSAGTGKTIVALHRAAFLARTNPPAKVLITTFSDPVANALRRKLKYLVGNEPAVAERIDVQSIGTVGRQVYAGAYGEPQVAGEETLRQLLADASQSSQSHRFSSGFLWTEWSEVVDAWQLDNWEAYRTVARLGRKTRLAEPQRRLLWSIFERVRQTLDDRMLITPAAVFTLATKHLSENAARPYDLIVVDEAQDLSVPPLRFLAALASAGPNGLFFAGDLGQRIFQPPFSWKSLGVDIRGRSQTLRINYRTSHQIRRKADRLLPSEVADVDGNAESRRGTTSVFNGPEPTIEVCATQDEEQATVAQWLTDRRREGLPPGEMAVFVRSLAQIPRALAAIDAADLKAFELDDRIELADGCISVGTLHLAKGLEFKAVVVMACDDEVIPLQERIDAVGDEADLEDVFDTERHLLYVGCTRARDHLLVTGVDPASEFLGDF
jgi:superfamily I DNA/RNA helicase